MSKTTHFDGDSFNDDPNDEDRPRTSQAPPQSNPKDDTDISSYLEVNNSSNKQSNSISEMCGLVPLIWRGMTFWGTVVNGSIISLEMYGSPIGGYSYLLRRSPQGNWRLEAWDYGDNAYGNNVPRAVLSDHPCLRCAKLLELIAVMAVMVSGSVPLSVMADGKSSYITRLEKRWSNWMRAPPAWACGTVLSVGNNTV